MKFSKFIVMLVLLLNVVFACVILWLVWHNRQEPGVLVAAWFAFTTGELWALAIVTKEEKKQESELNGMDGFVFKGRIYDEKANKERE